MLDSHEMRRRITIALKSAKRGAQAAISREADVTEQAVHGWKATGKIDKAYIPILARHTGRRVDYFLDASIRDDEAEARASSNDDDWESITAYAQAVGLGSGPEAQEYAEAKGIKFRKDSLSAKRLNAKSLVVMYGNGDSMEPTIKHGDAILFDTSDTIPRSGRVYVILISGAGAHEYNAKRYVENQGVGYFVADNPYGDHGWREPRPAAGINVVGRVLWVGGWIK